MSASGPPLCRICQKEHWMRDPHIQPANAPAEKRSTRNTQCREYGKGRKAENTRRDSSADCYSSRFTAQAGGTPVKNSQLSVTKQSKLIRREGALKYAGGSANAVIAGGAKFAPRGESPERKPGPNRAQNGLTARRDGKNTSREGRRVLKAKAARPDATRTASAEKHDPLSPLPPARGIYQTKAEKVMPGKRKTAPKAKKGKK